MNLPEFTTEITRRTGIPAALLTGETAEENIALAKALLAYKREQEARKPKTTAEQFAAWTDTLQGIERPDAQAEALAALAEENRIAMGGYPMLRDAGEADASMLPDGRPAREQFAEWFKENDTFNPAQAADGWITLT